MIHKNYFNEIGMKDAADKYAEIFTDDELVESTITVRLPKTVLEVHNAEAKWRSLNLEQSIERGFVVDAFMLARHLPTLKDRQRYEFLVAGRKFLQ
jgi:hypothetical protein